MRNPWIVVLLLASTVTAAAQDTVSPSFNLLDDPAIAREPVSGEQDKKEQDETRVITADKLLEEQPVGPYKRPEWTMHRRSPRTRIYLQVDPGEVEFEQWVTVRVPRGGGSPEVRLSEEFEFGLGGRFQLDLYVNSVFSADNTNSTLAIRSWAAELRYALADWGVIPGNPTLYLEYILWNNGHYTDGLGNTIGGGDGDRATSSIEFKVLFGGEIATRWHWGLNFFYEHTFNSSVMEVGVTGTLVYAVIDKLFSVGLSSYFKYESVRDFDAVTDLPTGTRTRERLLYVGPTFQFRMAPYESETEVNGVKTKIQKTRAHLDLEPLIGVTRDAKFMEIWIVFGWDF